MDQPVTCHCRMCGATWQATLRKTGASRDICSQACGEAHDRELAEQMAAHVCDPEDPYYCRE